MLNLRQLEVLRAVVHYGTTTAAADALGMSQPSISNTVRHVETLLGLKLFDRISNRLIPTQETLLLMEDSEGLFQLRDAVNQRALDLKAGRIGRIYIAATAELSDSILPKVMAAYKSSFPKVKLTLEVNRLESVLTQVDSGLADIGFMFSGYQRRGLEMQSVAAMQAVCLCRKDHPLAELDEVTPADLEGIDLVGPQTENRAGLEIANAFRAAGHEYSPEVEMRFMTAAAQMVCNGWGVTIVDALTARAALNDDVVIRPFAPKVNFTVSYVTASHKVVPQHMQKFINLFKKMAQLA